MKKAKTIIFKRDKWTFYLAIFLAWFIARVHQRTLFVPFYFIFHNMKQKHILHLLHLFYRKTEAGLQPLDFFLSFSC